MPDANQAQPTPGKPKWTKPKPGWSKLNVDAALDVTSGKMGVGWILRDDQGRFLNAVSCPWNGVFSPKEAEALAIREALSWSKMHNLDYMQIETDSLLTVQGLSHLEFVSSFDLLLADVKDSLSNFAHCSISFVKRSANRTAHLLARESLSMSERMEWVFHPPSFICNVLSQDLI